MKKRLSSILLILFLLFACTTQVRDTDKPNVIVTLFPQYDMIRSIAQDKVTIDFLLPAGVEPHAYEPSPSTIININNADLFVYTSKYMETWISGVFDQIQASGPIVVDSSIGIQFNTDEDEEAGYDPHYWLDPLNAKIMVNNITQGLIEMDPLNQAFYQTNSEAYLAKLDELDQKLIDLFKRTKTNKLIYGGHFAFGYLASRFNIDIISPYTGYSPDAEPSVSALAQLISTMENEQIKVIFYEELIDPKIARIISEQTGAQIEVLHGAHNVSRDEMNQGISYFEIMDQNIAKLKVALNYE